MPSRNKITIVSSEEVEKRAKALEEKMSQLEMSDDEGMSEGAREYAEAMGDFEDDEEESDSENGVYRTSPASDKSSSPLFAPISPPPAKVGAGWTMQLPMHIPTMEQDTVSGKKTNKSFNTISKTPPQDTASIPKSPEYYPFSLNTRETSYPSIAPGLGLSTPWRRKRTITTHPSPKYVPGSPKYTPHTPPYESTEAPWRPTPPENEATVNGVGEAMEISNHTPEPMMHDPYDADDSDVEEPGPRASGWSPGLAPKNKRLDAVASFHNNHLANPDPFSLPPPTLAPLGGRKRKADQVLVKHSADGVVDRKVKKLKKKKTAEEMDADMEAYFSTLR